MHSLTQEIRSFSRANLRKQRIRVTTLTGRKIIETWRGACLQVEEEEEEAAAPGGCGGYVQDLSADLQVGVVKPWLLLGSQDAAHDLETMRKYKVTHVLNVAYGVQNAFPDDFIYKTISILDLPETDITSYFPQCFEFIEKAKIQEDFWSRNHFLLCVFINIPENCNSQVCNVSHKLPGKEPWRLQGLFFLRDGVVLVHCNAGISRAAAVVIGFLMNSERLSFARAISLVKNARPAACPNPGFMEQLHKYQEQNIKANGSVNDHD